MAYRHRITIRNNNRHDSTQVDVVKNLQLTRFQPAKVQPKQNLSECLSVKSKDLCTSRGTSKVIQNHENDEKILPATVKSSNLTPGNNVSIPTPNNTQEAVTVIDISSQPCKGRVKLYQSGSTISREKYQKVVLKPSKGEMKVRAGIETKSLNLNIDEPSNLPCKIVSIKAESKDDTPTFAGKESVGSRLSYRRSRTSHANYRTALSYNDKERYKSLDTQRGHFTTRSRNSSGRTNSRLDRSETPSKGVEKSSLRKTRVVGLGFPDGPRNSIDTMRSKTAIGYHPVSPETRFVRSSKSARLLRHRTDVSAEEVDTVLSSSGCAALATRLETYVTQNNYQKFSSTVCSWDFETKLRVVNFKHVTESSSTIFFLACQLSRIQLVELMLEECSPDLEETGPFIVPEDDSIMYQVTPLWYAAATGNFQLVHLLTSHGANINATSTTKCTVIRAACCISHLPIVAFLIAHGADIHVQNKHGATCLMNAISSVELTKLLVHHGAKINEPDLLGNTALHYATEAGAMDTVVLLIEMGGNPMIVNKESCNAIQTAAKHRHKEILEYLLTVTTPRVDEIIDAYLLLGAMTIIIDSDYPNGIEYWHKAMNLRRINRSMRLSIQPRVSILGEFAAMNEMVSVEDLDKISADNGLLCLQALMTYERIRGPLNENYINLLMYRGAKCADEKNLTLAVNLWRTSYKLQLQKYVNVNERHAHFDVFNRNILRNLHFLVKVLHLVGQITIEKNSNNNNNNNDNNNNNNIQEFDGDSCIVSEENVRDLFGLVCHHTSVAKKILAVTQKDNSEIIHNAFHFLLKSCLCLFGIYLQIFSPAERSPDFGGLLKKLIQMNPRGENNVTLLHMCLNLKTLDFLGLDDSGLATQPWPYHAMSEILLLAGADSLARDCQGNTILHAAAQLHNQRVTTGPAFFKMLLRRGAHSDQVNHKGEAPLDILSSGDELRSLLRTTSLKCLAARQIAVHNIPYIGELPKCLYSFIELHGS